MGVNETCKHEIVHFENGTVSVRNTVLGEAMHSCIGPEDEADRVHLRPSRLSERLLAPVPVSSVVSKNTALTVYDLGLGIAANALASIERRLNLGSGGAGSARARRLRIISFENDLSGLELMLRSDKAFPLFARCRTAVETLIREGSWQDSLGQIEWQLRPGDFLSDRLEGLPPPEALFFDFYSPKATPALWGLGSFRKLRVKAGDLPCTLTTYSAATRIRSALLLAGFFVGYGDATSAKQETTVASTRLEDLERPLEADWFDKFNRSARSMPEDLPAEDWESARRGVLGSPQGQRWAPQL